MQLLRRSSLLLLLTLLIYSCTEDQLVEVAPLEHDLLITWIALEKGDSSIVDMYEESAQVKWRRLRQKFRTALLTEEEKQTVGMVNLWMDNLDRAVINDQPEKALVTVLHLQNQLKTLRPRFGIIHPADQLYSFNYSWDRIRETSHDQMMCLLEWKEFVEIYQQAKQQWQDYQKTHPNHSDLVFPGHGNNSAAAESGTLALTRALEDFGQLLEKADHTIMAAPSERVKTTFIDYLAIITNYPEFNL